MMLLPLLSLYGSTLACLLGTTMSETTSGTLAADGFAGELGLGSQSRDRMEVSMAQTSRIGVHCSFRMSRQMRPSLYTLGWKMGETNFTSGGLVGYSDVNVRLNMNEPPSQVVYSGLQHTMKTHTQR